MPLWQKGPEKFKDRKNVGLGTILVLNQSFSGQLFKGDFITKAGLIVEISFYTKITYLKEKNIFPLRRAICIFWDTKKP